MRESTHQAAGEESSHGGDGGGRRSRGDAQDSLWHQDEVLAADIISGAPGVLCMSKYTNNAHWMTYTEIVSMTILYM